MIPGWPSSVIAALGPVRTSWTAVLEAVRLGPEDDEAGVTAGQVREVITRLTGAGHWREGDPGILVIFGAGYDVTWLAVLPGRLRSGRVMQLPAPPRQPGTRGRPRKHGGELTLSDPGPGLIRRSPPARWHRGTGWPAPPPGTGLRSPRHD